MTDFLAQRAGLDFHAFLHAGHAVDDIGVGTGDIDHNARVDSGPIF